MPGWFVHVLDGGVRASAPVAAVSDFLSLSLEQKIHEPGAIEFHLPRDSAAAQEFKEGRQIRLYRGTELRSGGIIEKRVWTPTSVRVIASTQETLLSRVVLPPDVQPLAGSGMDANAHFGLDYYRPAHQIIEWLLRPVAIYTWLKEKWGQTTPTGASISAEGDLAASGMTITVETPEIDLGTDGYLLDHLTLELSTSSAVVSSLAEYRTSNTAGGGSYASISTSPEEVTTTGDSGTGRVRAWYPRNSTITLNRYVKFKVQVTTISSAAQRWYFLGVAVQPPALFAKGSNWVTMSPTVAFLEKNRKRMEGELARWQDNNLLNILHDLALPMGLEWELRTTSAGHELHLYRASGLLQPGSPSSVVDEAGVGTVAWSNPGNAKASDNAYATASGPGTTHYLMATGFGFGIPGSATIQGIVVRIERQIGLLPATVVDKHVRLVKNGTVQTTDKAKGSAWPTSDKTAVYGSSTDLWDTTWTPADVNAPGFGIALAAQLQGVLSTAMVDHIRVEVWYREPDVPAGCGTDKRSSVALVWGDQIAGREWAQATAEDLRTAVYLRSRLMPEGYYTASGAADLYIHTSYEVADDQAVGTHGWIHETQQAQTLTADNHDLTDDHRAQIAASKDPGVELEAPIVRPTPEITGLALGDIVTVIVPEHGVALPVRVHGISVDATPGEPEQWSLRLATLRKTPWDPEADDPGTDEIRRRLLPIWDDAGSIEQFVRTYTKRPRRTTKPGERA